MRHADKKILNQLSLISTIRRDRNFSDNFDSDRGPSCSDFEKSALSVSRPKLHSRAESLRLGSLDM